MLFRYGQKVDMKDADDISLKDFLDEEDYLYEEIVELYIELWNKVI